MNHYNLVACEDLIKKCKVCGNPETHWIFSNNVKGIYYCSFNCVVIDGKYTWLILFVITSFLMLLSHYQPVFIFLAVTFLILDLKGFSSKPEAMYPNSTTTDSWNLSYKYHP